MRLKSNAKSGEQASTGTAFDYIQGNSSMFAIRRISHFEGWYLPCKTLSIDDKKLKSADLFDAVHESVEIMRNSLKKLNKQFDELFSDENIKVGNY